MISKRIILFAVLFASLVTIGTVVAATVFFSQTISYTTRVETIEGPTNSATVDYGIVDANSQKVETYTIKNTGNVDITITASASATGATASWDKTTATLAPGESTTFTLTLTITGDGTCTVSFSKS